MAEDDNLDELLEAMERRARRLSSTGRSYSRGDTPNFGRSASALLRDPVIKVGDAIGENYEVERIIAQRPGSTVVAVRHRFVQRLFAMKLLPADLASRAEYVERFKDEARATSMIGHDSIVFVTDFGRSTRFGFYYVMEYLDGDTLDERLQRAERLSTQAALEIAVCAGGALAAVHELGIVHRDICPKNLMSHRGDGAETWKLLDFGLSSRVMRSSDAMTMFSDPRYVAPEVAAGDEIGELADQFGLAAVLYHALFGQPPWPGRTWTSATAESWTLPETDFALVEEVGPLVHKVLMRAMSPSLSDRFADVDSFVSAFQRATGHSRRATIPPLDIRDAARGLAGISIADADVTIGTSFDSEAADDIAFEPDAAEPPSVEISLEALSALRPKIHMAFQNAARLRREWRRNLISGGLFVPTDAQLEADREIVVVLAYGPTGVEAPFHARIVERIETQPQGLSVQIDESQHDEVQSFVTGLDLGIIDPRARITPVKSLTADADLTSEGAFVLSRLPEPTTMGKLRAHFGSLPMDLDEIVGQLAEHGWLRVETGRDRASSRPGDTIRAMPGQRHAFVRRTLERAEMFRSQGNYMAEIETLELAAQRFDEAEFHYRIAVARMQFLNDVDGAIAAIERATELAPDSSTYARALLEMKKLGET